MKKLLAAAALVLAATTGSALLGSAQAAPAARSPECGNAARLNDASWQEHYHCWNTQDAATGRVAPAKPTPAAAKSAECGNAARLNDASWQEHYHCWK